MGKCEVQYILGTRFIIEFNSLLFSNVLLSLKIESGRKKKNLFISSFEKTKYAFGYCDKSFD